MRGLHRPEPPLSNRPVTRRCDLLGSDILGSGQNPPRATTLKRQVQETAVKSSIKTVVVSLCLAVLVTGCATVESAYKSASDTVSDWFKSDDKKDQKK